MIREAERGTEGESGESSKGRGGGDGEKYRGKNGVEGIRREKNEGGVDGGGGVIRNKGVKTYSRLKKVRDGERGGEGS